MGDYAFLCVYAIFLVGKVVVGIFTHAASDLIDPQFVVQFVRHLEFLHATFLIWKSLWQVAKLHCNLTHPDSWFVEILKYESQKLQVGQILSISLNRMSQFIFGFPWKIYSGFKHMIYV